MRAPDLEPDFSWMAERPLSAMPPPEHVERFEPFARASVARVGLALDPILITILTAYLISLAVELTAHYIEECVSWALHRTRWNPFYARRVVKALAATIPAEHAEYAQGLAKAALAEANATHKTPAWKAFYPASQGVADDREGPR